MVLPCQKSSQSSATVQPTGIPLSSLNNPAAWSKLRPLTIQPPVISLVSLSVISTNLQNPNQQAIFTQTSSSPSSHPQPNLRNSVQMPNQLPVSRSRCPNSSTFHYSVRSQIHDVDSARERYFARFSQNTPTSNSPQKQ